MCCIVRELNRVRNRALSHAGSEEPNVLAEWVYISDDSRQAANQVGHFGKAEQTAMAYVDAYAKVMREP